jgi:hypothetical protein
MNLKPEYQKQYDELGLPYRINHRLESEDKNCELLDIKQDDFRNQSANEHLHLKQAVETLRDCCVIACTRISALPQLSEYAEKELESVCESLEKALKETDGLV